MLAFDANGNTLSDPSGKQYTWDFENRLVQAVVPGTVTFKYDPFGRRIQKSSPLGTTNYLYDGANSIEEVDNGGNVLARYARTKRLDEPLSELRSGTTSYYQQDGLGSVTSLSNAAGAVVETYTYDSYGKSTASTGTLVNPFQYTGREFDSETTLLFNRARYFDPSAGRFLNQDPIRFGGGTNFYAYTRNNPVVRIDPFGYSDGMCTNPAYCVPGSPTWGTMYLGPDGVWYNDGPPPDPAPPVPDDNPTPPPPPPAPNKCDKGDQSPPEPPEPPKPPQQQPPPPKRDCTAAWGETGIGIAATLGEVAFIWYAAPVLAEEGGISSLSDWTHIGPALVPGPLLYLHGIMDITEQCQ
jgi:RHS repeat-associated protein